MSLSMKRIGRRLITAVLSAAILATSLLPMTEFKAGADTIDSGNEIVTELGHIKAQLESAKKKVIDTRNNNHKIGMYPEMWKLTPSKTNRLFCLGTYTMQNNYSKQFVSFKPASSGNGGASNMMDQKNSSQSNLQLKLYYYPSAHGDSVRIASVNDPENFMTVVGLSNVWSYTLGNNIDDLNTLSVFTFTAMSNGTYCLTDPAESGKRMPMRQDGSFFGFKLAADLKLTDPKNQWIFTKVNTDNGQYLIKNAADNKALTVKSNGKDLTWIQSVHLLRRYGI